MNRDDVLTIHPVFIECSDGSWLARADTDSPLRVGAVGATQHEAEQNFKRALERLADALTNTFEDAQAFGLRKSLAPVSPPDGGLRGQRVP